LTGVQFGDTFGCDKAAKMPDEEFDVISRPSTLRFEKPEISGERG
jgi:hypothetical protein